MVKRLTDQHRDQIVFQFIDAHSGYSPKKVFEGVKGDMSRQSYFKSLARLKLNKAIREEDVNKRDKSLFVNSGDLIVKIRRI